MWFKYVHILGNFYEIYRGQKMHQNLDITY